MTTLYRAAKKPGVKRPRPTRRVPRNIPYIVDNLWAWARPKGYADRRHCAYASPTVELAEMSGQGDAYEVKFLGEHIVCQLPSPNDAKHHDDVRRLKFLAHELLGSYDWSSQELAEKESAGRLYMPALSASEVEQILDETLKQASVDKLRAAITFWNDVEIITDTLVNPNGGEIFFEYPGKYELVPIG